MIVDLWPMVSGLNCKNCGAHKVMEGCYRDVNIALANELCMTAEEIGVEFYKARSYAIHQFCHIHLPSIGMGGHCIPVYQWFLIKGMVGESFENVRLLRMARELNDSMIDYWTERNRTGILESKQVIDGCLDLREGHNLRQGVKEFYHNRNLALSKNLLEKGLNAYAWDELISKEEVEGKELRRIAPKEADLVFDCFTLKIESR